MIKNRVFLTGLGAGLIAGAVLLQLMIKVNEIENNPIAEGQQSQSLTLEQVKQQAEKHHYKLIPKDQEGYTSQEIEDLKKKAAEEERARTKSPIAQADPPKEKVTRTVFIPERMDATSIANLLVQAKVVDEPGKLIALLEEQQLSGKIRSGVYTFEDNPDISRIIKIITGSP